MVDSNINIVPIGRIANEKGGFVALTAVIILTSGIIAISLAAMNSALLYADQVNLREYRIQADLNAAACLDTAELMAKKNYFISGTIIIGEFGCTANVTNNFLGNVEIKVVAKFNSVSGYENGEVILDQ